MKTINIQDLEIIKKNFAREPKTQVFSLELINSKVENKTLILQPSYQRQYICSNKEASRYIESILLGCVIPEIQLFEEENGTLEVIDGQQRLTSLIKYINNEYRLIGLQHFQVLTKFYFRDLPIELQNKIRNYSISCRIMSNNEDKNYKFLVFERLNMGSKKLTAQEIRNCIMQGPFLDEVKILSENKKYLKTLSCRNLNNKRFGFTEFILRLISFAEYYPTVNHIAAYNINKLLIEYNEKSNEEIKSILDKYTQTIETMMKIVAKHSMFNHHGSINKTTIESVFLNIHFILQGKSEITYEQLSNNIEAFNEAIRDVINNDQTYEDFRFRTYSRESIEGRFKLIEANFLNRI